MWPFIIYILKNAASQEAMSDVTKDVALHLFYFSRIGTYQDFISDINKDFAIHPLNKESFSDLSVDVCPSYLFS